MKTKRPRRHVEKIKWCIEGEVEIGDGQQLIESLVPLAMRYVAAYSQAQAVKLLASRFTEYFQARVFIGNAKVYQIGVLPPDQLPDRITVFPPPQVPEVVQLSLF